MTAENGTTFCEGMYSKLIDSDGPYDELSSPNVQEQHIVHVSPARGNSRQPYKLATACLTGLCVILLLVLVVMSSRRNVSEVTADASAETQQQTLPVNVTELMEQMKNLEKENKELETERDILQERVKALEATPSTPPPARVTTLAPAASPSPPDLPKCPADWLRFENSCYYISRTTLSWMGSQRFCQQRGGHLAIIHTEEEQTFIWNKLVRGHWNAYWFGITDEKAEGTWHWVDGTALNMNSSFWEEGEPNNHIDEDCGYIVKTQVRSRVPTKSWYDAPCEMHWRFVCELELTAVSTTASV
ncbi:hepatic lectin isoform X1 [Alosa sapidissima]|uniref:hepatic lectin isoform X1 n=1 Tax=Alosa sapidissima TaxID=34773 RepID=UPI001C09C1CD|nr:hepatic lectin isoform X1 [Alosa sapidissima]